jgi:hypothetical protein
VYEFILPCHKFVDNVVVFDGESFNLAINLHPRETSNINTEYIFKSWIHLTKKSVMKLKQNVPFMCIEVFRVKDTIVTTALQKVRA